MLEISMAFWLVKSEPDVYSIDDLAREQSTGWNGVRNYQARNFLKAMAVGDSVLFYHSSSEVIGVAGVAAVTRAAYPDPTQFDKRSEYFDAAATAKKPRWFCPDIGFVEKFPRVVPIGELREKPGLKAMALLQRGSRLSVQPVSEREFKVIHAMGERSAAS
jgi:predicted RNA-binding protein with PUA-like domain